uniref:NADH-ubiquinone oxidoreductase chain 5 n=1 Tax=Japanagallia turriformis TaxID=3071388 RepID=A0AA50KVY0_9HEMI|nr:NADH dehydrogenase subunit 5 [Japanagallia turriformis]WMC21083.1 NADH dehydrogenase subunit 5 [Japanagallia turriformis]
MFNMNYYVIYFYMFFFFSIFMLYFGIYFFCLDFYLFFEIKLFSLNSVIVYYVLFFDWVSLIFCSVVLFISSMVILYSSQYMGYNSYSSMRFLYLVVIFIMSMLLMIISPNLLSILLGWDGLGLVSYCLVIYYSSVSSYLSGLITCMTNRLGDIGILISLSWMFSYGGWHFIFYNGYMTFNLFIILSFSCFTKSAQIPFSCWLPAAMAAPTPVSALVHSSTLVTAGIYLLFRFFSNLLVMSNFLLYLSLFTLIFSSFCANYEYDLKKIIALSTLSQLGLMMTSLYLGLLDLGYFHLLSHAMFKSMLFLCAGIYIYYMYDNQDIRMMGSLCMFMPITSVCFNISSMALCGIPFLSGFYSKDFFVEMSIFSSSNFIFYVLIYLSLGLTCCYSFRLFYYSMFYNMNFISLMCFQDGLDYMKLSISLLSLFSISFGSFFIWMMNCDMMFFFLPFYVKILSFLFVLLGFFFGLEIFNFGYLFNLNYYYFNSFMWFMNSHLFYVYSIFYNSSWFLESISYWGEYYGGYGVSYFLVSFSNYIQNYIFFSFSVSLFTYFLWLILIL